MSLGGGASQLRSAYGLPPLRRPTACVSNPSTTTLRVVTFNP